MGYFLFIQPTQSNSIGKAVDSLSSKYENLSIIGDFNTQASDTSVKDLCNIYNFKVCKDRTSML